MKNKLGKTRKPPISIITEQAIEQFRKNCNWGKDSLEEARTKIERDYTLGRVVSVSKKHTDGVCMVQYYDIFFKVNHTIVTGVFRSKRLARVFNNKFGDFEKDLKKYNKFNKKHGL